MTGEPTSPPEASLERMASDARELQHRAAQMVVAAQSVTEEYRAALASDHAAIVEEANAEAERIRAAARAEAEAIRARAATDAEGLIVPARAIREGIVQSLEGLREALESLRAPTAPAARVGREGPERREGPVDAPASGSAAGASARVRALELLLRGRSRREILVELSKLYPDVDPDALEAVVADLLLPSQGEFGEDRP